MHMIALLPFIAEAHPADKPMTQSCCSLLAAGEDLVPEVGLPKKRVVNLLSGCQLYVAGLVVQ